MSDELLQYCFFPHTIHLIHTYRELSSLGEEGNKEVSELSRLLCMCVLACVSLTEQKCPKLHSELSPN